VGSGAAATEAGPGTDYFFKTSPVAGTAQPVRLWAFGDEGQSSIPTNDGVVQRATRDAYYSYTGTTPTDLIVSLGDNAYNSGFDSEFQISVFDFYNGILRNTPFWPGIGNHETDGTAPYDYFKQFTFPVNGEAGGLPSGTPNYYSFNYANIHLVELDAQLSDRSVSAPMWTWLNNDLSANTQPWIIAYWHHAPYSHGSHNSDTDPCWSNMAPPWSSPATATITSGPISWTASTAPRPSSTPPMRNSPATAGRGRTGLTSRRRVRIREPFTPSWEARGSKTPAERWTTPPTSQTRPWREPWLWISTGTS
jgi:hypothetical protein